MNRIDLDALKSSIDLTNLAGCLTTLAGHKEQYGPCPKCEGRDRFHVTAEWFFCRKCHPRRGDCIEFAQWLNGLDFKAACEWLTNGNPPSLRQTGPQKPKPAPKPRPILRPPADKWQRRAAAFVSWAQAQLWQPAGRAGLDYLLNRGLTEATIKAAGLGYNPKDEWDKPAKWGVTGKKSIWLPGPGVVIPWLIEGQPWRVNIRLLEVRVITRKNGTTDEVKYRGPAGWRGTKPLYNADSLTPSKPAILVEGEFCALTLTQQAGDMITPVATGSTGGSRSGKWLARLSACPLVLVALDAEPGKGDEAAKFWLETLPNAKRWRPLLKDVNDMHRAGLDVRQWIQAGLPPIESKPDPSTSLRTGSGWPHKILWPKDLPLATIEDQRLETEVGIEATYHNKEELAICIELTHFARELTQ